MKNATRPATMVMVTLRGDKATKAGTRSKVPVEQAHPDLGRLLPVMVPVHLTGAVGACRAQTMDRTSQMVEMTRPLAVQAHPDLGRALQGGQDNHQAEIITSVHLANGHAKQSA